MMNPGALAGATGALTIAVVGNSDDPETTKSTLHLQAARLGRQFGLGPALARLVAAQAFGEARA